MKIGLWLFSSWLLYSCLGAFLNFVNVPWWVLVFYGVLALGWSSEASRFVLGIGFFGFWFRVISWLIAAAAILGFLVGISYGLIAGNWIIGAWVGLGMGTLAGLSIMVSAWLTFDIFFFTTNRKKAKLSNLDNLNLRIVVETIWVTFKGVGLAGIAVLGSYVGGVNGLTIATIWALLLAGVLFVTASEFERRSSRYNTFILLSLVLEIGLISGWLISYPLPR
ncbi:MAG: hypothetical protein AAF757_07770 [Cyanobacteria bacterium P01_D01_bin.116]